MVTPNGLPRLPGRLPAARSCEPFERRIGRKVLGNKAASGTEILKELGEEHLRTGSPILYTSGDSVFQIAAHEDLIPPEELYRIVPHRLRDRLPAARRLPGDRAARSWARTAADFKRTPNRRDFPVPPGGGDAARPPGRARAGRCSGSARSRTSSAGGGSRAPCTRSRTATASTRR